VSERLFDNVVLEAAARADFYAFARVLALLEHSL
jgi:hypothetical protein